MTAWTKNFVTDFAGPTNCTGAGTGTSATEAWNSFTTWIRSGPSGPVAGDTVTLTVPNGSAGGSNHYRFDGAIVTERSCCLFEGKLGGITLVYNCNSVTFHDGTLNGFSFEGASPSPYSTNVISARLPESDENSTTIYSVNAGSTSLQLKTASESSKFTTLQWILVTGLDLQGLGIPINPALCEYVKITAISGDIITFTPALTTTYLDTWPLYNHVPGETNYGGPATIYGLPYAWDFDVTVNDLIIRTPYNGQPPQAIGRKITFNNLDANGGSLGVQIGASECRDLIFNDCISTQTDNNSIEWDKMIQNLTLSGGTYKRMEFQSMSCVNTFMNNGMVVTGDISGTGRYCTIDDCDIVSLGVGAHGYGLTDTLTITNSNIDTFAFYNIPTNDPAFSEWGTLTNGVFTVNDNAMFSYSQSAGSYSARWAVPGMWAYFDYSFAEQRYYFQITNVARKDSGNTYIYTTLPVGYTGGYRVRGFNCTKWYGSNNTGDPILVDHSQPGAQGKPLFSYTKRDYTGDTSRTETVQIWGKLVSITYTILPGDEYTGVPALGFNLNTNVILPDGTFSPFPGYVPTINTKIAGVRTITPTSVTGAQSGDSLGSAPGEIWFYLDQTVPQLDRSISGEASGTWPVVTLEIVTHQGPTSQRIYRSIEIHGGTYRYA